MYGTGWDILALRASTTVWRGEGSYAALVGLPGLISALFTHPFSLPPVDVMCNIGSIPLAQ